MQGEEALKELDFGRVDSESEPDLDKRFVRTGDFDRFLKSETWIVLGSKGTGKSALFELFTKHEATARTLASGKLKDVIITAGTGFGDVTEIATGDLRSLRDEKQEYDHEQLWRLYIAIKAGLAIADLPHIPRGPLQDLLRGLGKKRDYRLGHLLRELWTLTIGQPPAEITISAQGASITLKGGRRTLDVITLLEDIQTTLTANGKKLWILFDKIDEIWPRDRVERQHALEGLIVACQIIKRQFPAIVPKVLLRTDIWAELHFTNKDHLTDKRIELNWSGDQLSTLLLKRGIASEAVWEVVAERQNQLLVKTPETLNSDEREQALTAIFPEAAYSGKNEARITAWIKTHVTDGRGTVLPRDAILLGNFAQEWQLTEGGGPWAGGPALLSREAVLSAFKRVSGVRYDSYLAEFPHLRDHFRRFSGQTQSEFSRAELLSLMSGLQPSGSDLLQEFYDIGLVEPDKKEIEQAVSFTIPSLYRQGIGLIIRGRP